MHILIVFNTFRKLILNCTSLLLKNTLKSPKFQKLFSEKDWAHKVYEFLHNSRGGSRAAATSKRKKKYCYGCILIHAMFWLHTVMAAYCYGCILLWLHTDACNVLLLWLILIPFTAHLYSLTHSLDFPFFNLDLFSVQYLEQINGHVN